MQKNHAERAEAYYTQVGKRNVEGFKPFLHADVEFYSPLAALKGKEAVVQATSNFMNVIQSLTIRSKFGTKDQAMIVYDVDIPGVDTKFPGASLMRFRDGLIDRIELFFDASRVMEQKKEVH